MASESHFVDHLAAVFSALPPDARGAFLTHDAATSRRAKSLGYVTERPNGGRAPVLVASYGDLARARAMGRRRIAIMEHGSGQSYGGRSGSARHGSYAGGDGRGAASLFLHPGPHPAARDRLAYPRALGVVGGPPHHDALPDRKPDHGKVVAFSFHFNAPIAQEARTAYPWIFPTIAKLRDRYKLLGHAHPRMFDQVKPRYERLGIEAVRDFSEVISRADLYVCDNSSTLFAAATRMPVVVLNPPWYDRRVDHGLRFEPRDGCPITAGRHFCGASHVGIQVNETTELAAAIDRALECRPEDVDAREAALDIVYAFRTGASQRAAEVLMDWAK
jgi:hypothetical protein